MNEITYHREGDYLIPNLLPPEEPHIGIWGQRRKRHLQQYHDGLYTALLFSGKLNAHLEEVDRRANEMLFQMVNQMVSAEGVTEQLKATDQMAWVGAMNNIRKRVEEVVYAELIYSCDIRRWGCLCGSPDFCLAYQRSNAKTLLALLQLKTGNTALQNHLNHIRIP